MEYRAMEDRYLRHGDRLLLKVDGKLGYVSANDRTVPQVSLNACGRPVGSWHMPSQSRVLLQW